jgi:Ca2+-binding RTX toxin-like protein
MSKNWRRPSNSSVSLSSWLAAFAGVMLPALVLAALVVGGPDDEVLEGTPSADTLDGRGGADTMMGLAGNDTYIVRQPGDDVIEGAGEGTDTVRAAISYTLPIFVENLTLLGASTINGTGNGLNNRLSGNAASNILNGRAGADRLIGLGGNDTFIVDSSGDVVLEAPGKGTDTVRSSATHTLRNNVEKLVLTGSAAIDGTGNNLPNTMTGNGAANALNGRAGNDRLSGLAGNDRLAGGPGNDRLTGGPGQDAFVFDTPLNAATNIDQIIDFSPANDVMRLQGSVFQALTTAGVLPAPSFRAAGAAGDASDRILYDPATGALRYDADGSGPVASVRFAILAPGLAVTNLDFVVQDPVSPPIGYLAQVQPIFTINCTQCHSGSSPPQGLRLDSQNSYANIVNVASTEVPSLKRIKPGDDKNSYLVQKIEGTAAVGARMPFGGPALSFNNIALIRQWVVEGANP